MGLQRGAWICLLLCCLVPGATDRLPAQACNDLQASSLHPGPDLDENGDGVIQLPELEVIHQVVPQFILLGADDNGFLSGLQWLEEQAHRHGFWGKITYFITSTYSNQGPAHTGGDIDAYWQHMARHNPVGLHSRRHQPGGTAFTEEDWTMEQGGCQRTLLEVLRPVLGTHPEDYLWGARAPYLQYNDAYFETLQRLPAPIFYDSSIEATDVTWGVNMPFYRAPWPFTMDQGLPPGCRTSLLPPDYREYVSIHRHECLWQIPIYQYVWKGKWSSPFDINIWSPGSFGLDPAGDEARQLLSYNLDLHLHGNRAPFSIGLHSQNFTTGKVANRALYEWLFDEIDRRIAAGEPWRYVDMLELIEYLRDREPPRVWFLEDGATMTRGLPREVRIATDTEGGTAVLRYRRQGELTYTTGAMEHLGQGVLRGVIPAEATGRPLELDVVARDLRGNQSLRPQSAPRQLDVVARDRTPPRVEVEVVPEQPLAAGLPVTLSTRMSADAETGIDRVLWDLDLSSDTDQNGVPDDDQDLEGEMITLETGLPAPGLWHLQVAVVDLAGNAARQTLHLAVDRWAWDGNFTGWELTTAGASADRLVALQGPHLELGLADAWWFTVGSEAHARRVLEQAPGRLRVEYSAVLPEEALIQVHLGSQVVHLPPGTHVLELACEDPEAREIEFSFRLQRTIETRKAGYLRIRSLTVHPRL